MLSVFILSKTSFFGVIKESSHLVWAASFWRVLVYSHVSYSENFLNIRQQNGVTLKETLTYQFFEWDSLAGTCSVSVCLLCKLPKRWAAKLRNRKGMIDISHFRVRDPVTGTCPKMILSNYLLIGWWCNISKSVNHIIDHYFKCLFGSVISTDKSECVASSAATRGCICFPENMEA